MSSPVKARSILFSLGLSLALLSLASPPSAHADPTTALLRGLLERQAVRAALATQEGRTLFRALGIASGDARGLLRITEQAAAKPLREELAQALNRIETETNALRTHREKLGAPLSATEERFFVELMSRRVLEIGDLREFTRRFGPQSISFVDETVTQGTLQARSRIFAEGYRPRGFGQNLATERASDEAVGSAAAAEGRASQELIAESAPGAARSLRRTVRGYLDEMRACQLRQPPSAAQSSRTRYLLTSLAAAEALTVGGYIAGMGIENVKIEELSTDMLVAAVYTLAGASVLRPNTRFAVQWVKVVGALVAQDAFDATVYFISPLHRIRTGESLHTPDEAFARFAFSAAYTSASCSWREVVMYEVISGLQCLYPTSKWTPIGTTALRLADGAVGTLLYYKLRSGLLGH